MSQQNGEFRVDFEVVTSLVSPGSRVLDIGCGDGSLLERLQKDNNVDARGIELEQTNVNQCVARGLAVIQGDADTDLSDYPDDHFDYVILSQTLQTVGEPKTVLDEMLRIGKTSIVSLPNFGCIQNRLQILLKGRMPMTKHLPYEWFNTPNIHFCTIRDFLELCKKINGTVERTVAFTASGIRIPIFMPWWFWNLFGQQAVFLLRRNY